MNIQNSNITHISYWIGSTNSTNFEELKEDLNVEVAIVGAGITGITCAYLLKKAGVKVALFDMNRIAYGTTGHTTAKITCQHNLIYKNLIKNFGEEKASKYARMNMDALNFIKNTVYDKSIDCNFEIVDSCVYTTLDSYTKDIEDEESAAKKLGFKTELMEKVPLPIDTKLAYIMKDQAQFHPRKYLLKLLEEYVKEGGLIYENTKIMNYDKNENVLITQNGNKIHAEKVVIATHFPFLNDGSLYYTRLYAESSYALASLIKDPFPKCNYINVEEPTRSLRTVESEAGLILITGGESHKTGQDNNTLNKYKALKDFTERYFNPEKYVCAWMTQDYMTVDDVPFIGRFKGDSDRVYVATGYKKWGMTTGTAAAMILKDLILVNESEYEDLLSPSRPASMSGVKNFFVENFDTAKQLITGKLKKLPEDLTLEKGEAKEMAIEGEKYGAYKDHEGNVYIVDKTCTHLGCELKWNAAEKTWDCPCHGSRFDYKGHVIDGAALRDLNVNTDMRNNVDPDFIKSDAEHKVHI